MLAVGDWAYLLVGLAVPVFGFLGLWLQTRKVSKEVSSPNGIPTGSLAYEAWKHVVEVREQVSEMREAQLAGWERAYQQTEQAERDRARLEQKVDDIYAVVDQHDRRDENRFFVLFRTLGVDDPGQS